MQFKQIALAAATLVAAASSFAALPDSTDAYLTGASASQPDVIASLKSLCPSGLTISKATADAKLENIMTYSCGAPFSSSGVNTVYHNVNGGSLNSVILPQLNTLVTFIDPAGTCTPFTGPAGQALTQLGINLQTCSTKTHQSEGGFSDTEPSLSQRYLDSKVISLTNVTTKSANLLQAFGVAVSDDLYVLLYKAQIGSVIPSTVCPAATATNDDIVAAGFGSATVTANTLCQPSVSRAEMASVMSGSPTTLLNGVGVFNNVASTSRLVYCRRPVTSGTQVTAENYFLTNPAAGLNGPDVIVTAFEINDATKIAILAPAPSSKFGVLVGSGTGDTLNCIGGRNADSAPGTNGTVSATNNFRIGVVSAERIAPQAYKAPVASPAAVGNWKFVRLSEVYVSEGGTTPSNTTTAKAGRYDLVVESRYNTETGITPNSTDLILGHIAANISGSAFPGMYKINGGTTSATSFNHKDNDSKKPLVR